MSNDDALDILYTWMADWSDHSEPCKEWDNRRTALALAIVALREKIDREKRSKEIPFITMRRE